MGLGLPLVVKVLVMLFLVDFAVRGMLYHSHGHLFVFQNVFALILDSLGFAERSAPIANITYAFPTTDHVVNYDWHPARSWRIKLHVLTTLAWLCGAGNLFGPASLRNRYPAVHRWSGRFFGAVGLPGVLIGALLGSTDQYGLVAQLGFVGMGLNTATWIVFAWVHAWRGHYTLHALFAKMAFWSGFSSSVIYRLLLVLVPIATRDPDMMNFDLPRSAAVWQTVYVTGAWATWVVPLLIFAVVLALRANDADRTVAKKGKLA